MIINSKDLNFINSILIEVWELILDNLDKTLSMREDFVLKDDDSPVTKADFFHEKLISEFLSQKIRNLIIIAEESFINKKIPQDKWLAILDPIDGTENFASGLKEWGVALSIWKGEKHYGSGLYLPELNQFMISGQKIKKFNSRIVGLSSSYTDQIGTYIKSSKESRIMGCCVYNSYNVIRGSYSKFVNPKGAYCWDIQASVMLALEHSCKVELDGHKYDGRMLEPHKRHCINISN